MSQSLSYRYWDWAADNVFPDVFIKSTLPIEPTPSGDYTNHREIQNPLTQYTFTERQTAELKKTFDAAKKARRGKDKTKDGDLFKDLLNLIESGQTQRYEDDTSSEKITE